MNYIEKDALDSLSESLKDYLNYAIEKEAFDEIIDPDEEEFWKIDRKLELQNELMTFKKMAKTLKKENSSLEIRFFFKNRIS